MTITYPGTIFAWSTLGAFLSEVTLQGFCGTKHIRSVMWLVRKVRVASHLYSLCLLWVRECRRLLSLRAYPAGRGGLELRGSREVRWLPVVYREGKIEWEYFAKGNGLFTAFIFYAFILRAEAKGPIKNALFGGESKTF